MENIVISLGGSLIIPNGGINTKFLKRFNLFIRSQITARQRRFFIVCGGGATARHYQQAARDVIGQIESEDVDWLGIHATRLNAHLLRTIFRDIAYFRLKKHYDQLDVVDKPVMIASGWKPGCSTDFDAVLLAEEYQASLVINLSNIPMVYDKDPKEFKDAKPFSRLSWIDFRRMVGDTWSPGMNVPFDPVAAKKAQELGLKVVILKGDDLENVEKFLEGKEFVGTLIE
ncbi:UMP kinase [Candidatus Gottesmanbacteria bacterium]|nr:UMP kinase [Candidatus Gottesmanbacteria bacterium]